MRKFICFFLILTILTAFLSGCNTTGWIKPYNSDAEVSIVASEVVASNDLLTLSWDDSKNNVLLTCKQTGKVWSTVPDGTDDVESSSLDIRVQDTFIRREDKYYSKNADHISSEKIKNGIKITYRFDELSIAVPVNYTLRDDSLLISINGKEIVEGKTRYQLIAATPAPMLCRTGVDTENAYIFVPKALGGVIDTKVNADEAREMSGYNSNIASMEVDSLVNADESTGFKCYGIKENDSALFCIAEDTPGAIGVKALAGSKINTYSTVSSTFYLTDYDYFYGAYVLDGMIKQLSAPYMGTISVGIYPLAGEKADYNGFAECYRNYLYKTGYIKEKKAEDSSPYSITYMGGVLTTTSVAGVPKKILNAMTTFSEAAELTDKLKQETGVSPVVRLSGYGITGVNIGKIAGGYEFSGKLGGDKSRKELEDYCKKNSISLFTDFGVVYFSESGNGFSYGSDSARTAVLHAAEISPVNIPLRDFNEKLKYRLLKRGLLGEAVDKLISMANKKEISGISLNDLGSISYSDYSDVKYSVTNCMDTDTKKFLQNISAANHKLAVSSATYFAAGLSDTVFDAPTETCGNYIFKDEIPFYQMVFHGVVPMYSTAVNTSADVRYKLMLAVASGNGLGFSIINNFEKSYMETNAEKLYSMYFEDNVDFIKSAVKEYAPIYEKIKNSKISRYDILENNITKTTFENGVCIYANHSNETRVSPVGELKGYGFAMGGESVEKD